MKDLSGLTHSFQEWSAILDFLANITQRKETVSDIHITRQGDKGWIMRINGTNTNANRKPKTSGAALYDLYW